MFTYNLTDKAIENGQARVTFEFTDGTVKVSRTWIVTDEADIDRRIESEIASLDKAVALNGRLVKNAYVKAAQSVKVETALETAEKNLYRLKNLISLGVIKETDQEFIDAVVAYKTAANPK
jgi:hypothetical protein